MFVSCQQNIASKLFIQRLIGNGRSSLKLIEQRIIIVCKYNAYFQSVKIKNNCLIKNKITSALCKFYFVFVTFISEKNVSQYYVFAGCNKI